MADAMANLAPVPDGLTDEQVLMCPDIMSTGFSGAEGGHVAIAEATVNYHIRNLVDKLGANDRTHAVTIAVRRGLLQI